MFEWLIMGGASLLISGVAAGMVSWTAQRSHAEALEEIQEASRKKATAVNWGPENRFEMGILNTLYLCKDCEQFTRQHIMELNMLKEELKTGKKPRGTCPNCGSENYTEAQESYSWQQTHRHCYRLNDEQFEEHKELVADIKARIKQVEEMKAFEQYERKHLANGMRSIPGAEEYKRPGLDEAVEAARALRKAFKSVGYNLSDFLEEEAEQLERPPEVNAMGLTPEEQAERDMKKLKASPEGQAYLKPQPFQKPDFSRYGPNNQPEHRGQIVISGVFTDGRSFTRYDNTKTGEVKLVDDFSGEEFVGGIKEGVYSRRTKGRIT